MRLPLINPKHPIFHPFSTIDATETSGEPERFMRNFVAKEHSAALYEALAARERDLRQAAIYRRLAASELDHADHWRARLRTADHAATKQVPSLRTRLLIYLARWIGKRFVIPSQAVSPQHSVPYEPVRVRQIVR